jgi:ubiquinone/menaquinone biosynthesis C-methylase UbiE
MDSGVKGARAAERRCGFSRRAVGVDANAEMVAVAEQRRPRSVEVVCASATALPFADRVFDAYRAERVYQHLDEPKLALAEARRVLRSEGAIPRYDAGLRWPKMARHDALTGLLRMTMLVATAERFSSAMQALPPAEPWRRKTDAERR